MATSTDHMSLPMPLDITPETRTGVNNRKSKSALNALNPEITLKEKLRIAYTKPSPLMEKFPSLAGAGYFWFIAVSELYLLVCFAIPHVFRDYSDTTVYYLKVMSWIIFIETIANWLCTRFYDTALNASLDNPSGNNGNNNDPCDDPHSSEKNDSLTCGYCVKCDHVKPYRTHHCRLCKKCILKRDHHCYFTGVCIGFFNQRFFIMLNFYIILASSWGLYVIGQYMSDTFRPRSNWDYFLPITAYNFYTGRYIPQHQFLMMFQMYTLWWTGAAALGFFLWHVVWVVPKGLTTHEVTTKMEYTIRNTASVSENFRSVFGALWLINFILPAVILFRQEGDGKSWTHLKFVKYIRLRQKGTSED